jgi:hypothetical protein
MAAPIAAWTRKFARAEPARAADELSLVSGACAAARGARRGKEKIEQGARDAAPASR